MGFKCGSESETRRKIIEREKNMKKKCTAIVLAAGKGSRMGTKVHKQYLELKGKPVLFYSLNTFEKNDIIDNVILVTGRDEIDYCRKDIVERYGFKKVTNIVAGGKERYESVYNALNTVSDDMDGYIFIHDGARPFVTDEMILRCYESTQEYNACVVGMPVKDTIKIVDEALYAKLTPERKFLWQVQTPQVFGKRLVCEAYDKMMESGDKDVTDDAMVVERYMDHPVKMVEGSYKNIKITTPEDLQIAAVFATE